jgi:hypothetical protein
MIILTGKCNLTITAIPTLSSGTGFSMPTARKATVRASYFSHKLPPNKHKVSTEK